MSDLIANCNAYKKGTRKRRDEERAEKNYRGFKEDSKVPVDRQAYIEQYGVHEWNRQYDIQEERYKKEGILPIPPFNIYILRDKSKTTTSREYATV